MHARRRSGLVSVNGLFSESGFPGGGDRGEENGQTVVLVIRDLLDRLGEADQAAIVFGGGSGQVLFAAIRYVE